jgi:hypothetical protein
MRCAAHDTCSWGPGVVCGTGYTVAVSLGRRRRRQDGNAAWKWCWRSAWEVATPQPSVRAACGGGQWCLCERLTRLGEEVKYII